MITSILVALFLVVALSSFVALRHAQVSAVDGYEDENGFHFGIDPRAVASTPSVKTRKTPARAGRAAVSTSHAAAGIHAGSHI